MWNVEKGYLIYFLNSVFLGEKKNIYICCVYVFKCDRIIRQNINLKFVFYLMYNLKSQINIKIICFLS